MKTGPMIIENAKSCYDAVKTTDKCTFSGSWPCEQAAERDIQMEYSCQ
jgi:hypothetical protein